MRFARGSSGVLAASLLLVVGCVPLRGGWDSEALVASEPRVAALEGQRLGDMLPFPALDGDRIVLIACRYEAGDLVRVRGGGPQWPVEWARSAVRALDRSVARVDLILEDSGGSEMRPRPTIDVVTVEAVGGAGPVGLGDTLSECDVSSMDSSVDASKRDDGPRFRGVLTGAEIRMRRAQLDQTGQVREASAEEWVGALMHELAHALGFAGHVAVGDSILVRDEMEIRSAGRRALLGESVPDETLAALYQLRPGQILGSRTVQAEDVSWLRMIRELDRARSIGGRPSMGLFASVGDREARIVWRYADGSQLGLRFPNWQRELRRGDAITLRPDRQTRLLLSAAGAMTD